MPDLTPKETLSFNYSAECI